MACRRCLASLTRHFRSRFLSNAALENPQTLIFRALGPRTLRGPLLNSFDSPAGFGGIDSLQFNITRHLSSRPTNPSDEEEEDEEEGGESCEEEGGEAQASRCVVQRGKSEEEKIKEASEIGYKVTGPLDPSENPFKPYEPVFAVVQIGSHQFKVSNGDSIFTERLKFCEVNDKVFGMWISYLALMDMRKLFILTIRELLFDVGLFILGTLGRTLQLNFFGGMAVQTANLKLEHHD
uniref:Large ribosomal subunit protein bL21m n=1 Tax=Elaeis guineensis var. tenera TaxID=51953 RepID=A0A8N4I9E2_ELAGV|nr:uncharacterized protein LOC105047347 isoform X2 [Elaeis guineensis]